MRCNGRGFGCSGDGIGVHINRSKRLGHAQLFPPQDGEVIWSNAAVGELCWTFIPFSFPFPSLTQFDTPLCVDT